jgi:hypothetical protein
MAPIGKSEILGELCIRLESKPVSNFCGFPSVGNAAYLALAERYHQTRGTSRCDLNIEGDKLADEVCKNSSYLQPRLCGNLPHSLRN